MTTFPVLSYRKNPLTFKKDISKVYQEDLTDMAKGEILRILSNIKEYLKMEKYINQGWEAKGITWE